MRSTDQQSLGDYYRVLAETAEDHIFVIDRGDRIEYCNPSAARAHGALPEQLIGRCRSEIFPPDVAERQGRNLAQVFATGKPLYVEGRTLYGDREVWLSTWLAPVSDGNSGVKAVLGVSRDMTDRKRAEDELRASEQRRRLVLAHVPLVMWATDRRGTVTLCTGRGLEQLGASSEAMIGRAFGEAAVEPFPSLRAPLGQVLAGESVSHRIAVGERTFDTSSVPLRDEQGAVAGATGVIVDITERLHLEVELSNAQKLEALGRLAGGIAHDFNNNLTAILGYVELMTARVPDTSPAARDLTEVRHAAERSAGLVRRLLAFARHQVLQPRSLDLNAVIAGLRPMLERLLGEHIRIDVNAAPELPAITGDAGEIEHVIMNLALNARDAMPDGGTLTIDTANVTAPVDRRPTMAAGPYVLMRVADTGAGMTPQVRQHVFEPFFTTKPPDQGTGLGLSAAYGIIKQLNGFIWVESEVGTGSTFSVYWPALATAAREPRVSAAPEPQAVGRPDQTILLVEDEDTVRRFARLALERSGFRVIEAATPEEALAHAAGDQPLSLLLTDVVMPRMSGPELAGRLTMARPGLPVLYMSGYPSSVVSPDGGLAPSGRLLAKPFTIAQLIASVRAALEGA